MCLLSQEKDANSLGFVHQTRIYTEGISAFSMLILCELMAVLEI